MNIYRFTGDTPEVFPFPPIARWLDPGQEITTDEPVEHARLLPIDGASTKASRPRRGDAAQTTDGAPDAPITGVE